MGAASVIIITRGVSQVDECLIEQIEEKAEALIEINGVKAVRVELDESLS